MVVAGAVLLLLLGMTLGLFFVHSRDAGSQPEKADRHLPPDPRATYSGPFQNIRPEVTYVGDRACAKCHKDKAESYRNHPMGRSILPVAQAISQMRFDPSAHDSFAALDSHFQAIRQGDRLWHREFARDDKGQTIFEVDTPVSYALGSGSHGSSFLVIRDGYLLQSPVSWFSQKQVWDVSPGFSLPMRAGRGVIATCLFCHANHVRPTAGYVNRYETPVFDQGCAIGCERCHGPGSRHIENPGERDSATGIDYTIVNPKFLQPKLRADVCEQCHLAGEARLPRRGRELFDYRPGLPLEDFWAIFVQETDPKHPHKAVNHVEQMQQSRCYRMSQEDPAKGQRKLGCVSCHDPHEHVEPGDRVAYYRKRCLQCHERQGCSLDETVRRQQNKADSCIDCHMPRYASTDIAHNASTDHRIVRRPDPITMASEASQASETRLVSYFQDRLDATDPDTDRDLGIGMLMVFQQKRVPRAAWDSVLHLLERGLENDPEDRSAQEAKAMALTFLNRPAEALAALDPVLTQSHFSESALTVAAMLAERLKLPDQAIDYWQRAVEANPYQPNYRAHLVQLLAKQRSWKEALPHARVWVQLDPAEIEARVQLTTCLARLGDKKSAQEEFLLIERLNPTNLPVLRARFNVELRAK
jgi:tetratricopeptide (TPR) repeat protein